MKKILIAVILLTVLILPISISAYGKDTYLEASQALSSGDVETARAKFTTAALELSGVGQQTALFMASLLDKMSSTATVPTVIKDSDWHFIGEVEDTNGVHHLYYDEYSNSIFHSRVEDGATPEELATALGIISSKQKVTGDAYGYKTSAETAIGDMQTRVRLWNCGDTTHISYETFSSDKASSLDSTFSGVKCPAGGWGYPVIIIIIVAIGGILAFLYFKTSILKDLFGKIKNIKGKK